MEFILNWVIGLPRPIGPVVSNSVSLLERAKFLFLSFSPIRLSLTTSLGAPRAFNGFHKTWSLSYVCQHLIYVNTREGCPESPQPRDTETGATRARASGAALLQAHDSGCKNQREATGRQRPASRGVKAAAAGGGVRTGPEADTTRAPACLRVFSAAITRFPTRAN